MIQDSSMLSLAMLLNHGSNEVLARGRESVNLARCSEWRSNKEKFVIAAVSFLRSSNWITSSGRARAP